MKTFEQDGVIVEINSLREDLIRLRDAALEANNFAFAVSLSYTIALLAKIMEMPDGR